MDVSFDLIINALIAGILLGVCAVVLLWRAFLVFIAGHGHEYTYFATDTRLDSLLFGCILGVWGNPALDRSERTPGKLFWLALHPATRKPRRFKTSAASRPRVPNPITPTEISLADH